jgi:hypothetical protein
MCGMRSLNYLDFMILALVVRSKSLRLIASPLALLTVGKSILIAITSFVDMYGCIDMGMFSDTLRSVVEPFQY